jgi:hypothetical protein
MMCRVGGEVDDEAETNVVSLFCYAITCMHGVIRAGISQTGGSLSGDEMG